jgi:hypothetical protein
MKSKLHIRYDEDTGSIFVTILNMGLGFPGVARVEVRPGECYANHPYRRLKRWCGEAGACEKEVDVVAPNLVADIPVDAAVEDG